MRKVCVVTGSRAEYGLLSPVMQAIQSHPDLGLSIIVTGMHLMTRFGMTVQEIKKDGFRIDEEVPVFEEDDMAGTFGQSVIGISKAIKKINPAFVLILGDRFEALAGAIVGASNNIPVAHIHSGDKTTSGHIDESIRFAITRFSHLHFAATQQSYTRLLQTGEENWRIHLVGSPAIDVIKTIKIGNNHQIAKKLHLSLDKPIIVVTQHPVSIEVKEARNQMEKTLQAVSKIDAQIIIIYPNSDPGSNDIIEVIQKHHQQDNFQIYKNIDHQLYLELLSIASVLVGNSSSGIIEAPSFKLPVVNIGSRNVGREHADNLIFVDYNSEQIEQAIKKTLWDEEFKKKVNNCINPYGDGKSAQRIVEILTTIPINQKLLKKQITY